MIAKLAIIGVGLIGGSLAMSLRAAGQVGTITGCGRGAANLKKAVELGVIDDFCHDPAEAVKDADVIFLAVPLGAMQSTLAAINGHVKAGAVVTDGGSAKGVVVEACQVAYPEILSSFVPGHPIAGTEQSGVEAAFAELYSNRRVILTPLEQNTSESVNLVRTMWQHCGAVVSDMDVSHHDRVLAATSHLPHMLAYGLVDMLARSDEHDDIFRYAAGGFRDFTRIASSNPVMWRDICMGNKQALSGLLANFASEMQALSEQIAAGNDVHLLELFERAKTARDDFVDGVD